MAFSTKLNLDDSKFEQQSGSTLNLDGDNIIGGSIKYSTQPINPTDTDLVSKKYVDDNIVSGTSSGVTYNLSSPSTIDVGGILIGTELTGKSSNELLEEILAPIIPPSLSAPNNTMGFVTPVPTSTQEVGDTITTINFTATFDRGTIDPANGTSGFRSGLPNTYNFSGTGLPPSTATTSLTVSQSISSYAVTLGTNSWGSSVDYDIGEQPYYSDGTTPYDSALLAGTTGSKSASFTGIYPYFYGTTPNTRPTADSALVNTGTKVLSRSNVDITVDWNSAAIDYIWFAIPTSEGIKTTWTDTTNSSNSGTIGGADLGVNLFPDATAALVTTTLWAGINYNIYISNYQVEQANPLRLS